jgi:hypothetical protein
MDRIKHSIPTTSVKNFGVGLCDPSLQLCPIAEPHSSEVDTAWGASKLTQHSKTGTRRSNHMENVKEDCPYVEEDCPYYDDCDAPLCPLRTREENLQHHWHVGEDICELKGEVPKWVQQQRKIQFQAKRRNWHTIFELVMLEAPLEVNSRVKGLNGWDENMCWNCKMRRWFEENRLPIPPEVEHGC